ncbi:MAG: DUF2807 domain-containing protein [Cyclobacteriaceae bacterium]|nr:DUF2807 domain-containing protein [Cyclobacteriaceae bacterium]
MIKPGYSIFFLVQLVFFYTSCDINLKRGNGNITSREVEVEAFEHMSIGGNYNVVLIRSDESKVVLSTDENLLRYINVEARDGKLSINNVHNLNGTDGISVEVFYNELNSIYSSGTSRIQHEGPMQSAELLVDLSGAGAIDLDIETSRVEVNLSGAGVIDLSGETDVLEVRISGAGGLMAADLQSVECNIRLSGLGGAEIFVTEKLIASITGVGGIEYGGNPKMIEKQITGFGKIERAKEYLEESE